MRRAAVLALRAAAAAAVRRGTPARIFRAARSSGSAATAASTRSSQKRIASLESDFFSHAARPQRQSPHSISTPRPQLHLVPASMYFRNFSVALVSTLVASGAYFAYRDGSRPGDLFSSSPSASARPFATASILPSQAKDFAPEQTRRALVVEQDQLYTGTIVGDGPLAKSTDDQGRKVLEMMTPDQATERIRRNQESYLVGRGKGVVRYDIVQLASNDPIEDDHAEKIVNATGADWMFWGVFDGHSGWTTSARLREQLISYVARELNSTYTSAKGEKLSLPSPSSIDEAIKRGFVALDKSIVHDSVAQVLKSQSKPQAASLLAPALSGSCALLSFYDTSTKTLRVACTGDSRAVLGRRASAGKWAAHALSVDQTGDTEEEVARIRAEHPQEPDVIRVGRVLGGLQPTRAFGDATYKWSRDIQAKMKEKFFGRTMNPQVKTPPYVTAEPVVTTTQVQPEKGDFLVMATDGLWEMLTNEEVVGLVGQWLDKNPGALKGGADAPPDGWLKSWFAGAKHELPVVGATADDPSGQRAPIRQQQWGLDPSTGSPSGSPASARFVVEDANVAAHLIRNALGGGDRDMVCALLTLPAPYSRRYRDDLTVSVVFFGDEPPAAARLAADGVAVNAAATAAGARPRL